MILAAGRGLVGRGATSMPATRIVLERNVEVSLRDGSVTRADVYRPDDAGGYLVLLQRTPYDKTLRALKAES